MNTLHDTIINIMSSTTPNTHLFSIKTQSFEGPLELLLDLVEKRKFLVNDISLASVTDEYIAQVSQMQELSLPNTAQFITLAATLLLIKSKSLLPILELTQEEEEGIDDLEVRLRRYKMYRDIAKNIEAIFGIHIARERQFVQLTEPLFVTDPWTTKQSLHSVITDVLTHLPKKEIKPKVSVRKTISLEEMMRTLHQRIDKHIKLSFRELVGEKSERGHVIVGFLAVLESVKQGSILVAQLARFEDIHIEKQTVGAPKYY